MEVTVTIKRGKDVKGTTYLLKESGESKKGTYKVFSPNQDTADIPDFAKLYIKVKAAKVSEVAKKSK